MPYKILPKRIVSKNNAKVRFSYETTKGKSGKMRYFLSEELFGQGFCGRWRGLSQVLVDGVDVVEHIVLAHF